MLLIATTNMVRTNTLWHWSTSCQTSSSFCLELLRSVDVSLNNLLSLQPANSVALAKKSFWAGFFGSKQQQNSNCCKWHTSHTVPHDNCDGLQVKCDAKISEFLDRKQRWNDILAPVIIHQYLTSTAQCLPSTLSCVIQTFSQQHPQDTFKSAAVV